MLILTDEGDVEYLSDTDGDYKTLKKLNLPKKVSQIYPEVPSKWITESGLNLGEGVDTLIVYADGEIADFHNTIKQTSKK